MAREAFTLFDDGVDPVDVVERTAAAPTRTLRRGAGAKFLR